MEKDYDIAIIGSGPAGISAALTARNRNKKIILFGNKNLSTKIEKTHAIDNYPGLPHITGADMVKAFQASLDNVGIEVTEKKVTAVYAMGDYFTLQADNDMITASAVIITAGVIMQKPLPGETELLGRGVSYCATCDAPLYRNKEVAVLGFSEKEEAEANFLSEVCSKVYYFPFYKNIQSLNDSITVVTDKAIGIEARDKKRIVKTQNSEYKVDGTFVLRDSVFPGQLVPGLAIENNHIATDRKMATNIAGCYAAGDITGAPYQIAKAVGEGNIAAISAAGYLDTRK